MGAGQIFNFILKCHCTDDFSRQMARYFPRRLKSSVRGRLKICPAPFKIHHSLIEHKSITDPSILKADDVIVKVHIAGIWGSDLHVYHGRETGIDCGTAMGHEFVGEIIETGKAVTHFRKGDMVISPFTTNCGTCYFCQIGLTCRCVHNQNNSNN